MRLTACSCLALMLVVVAPAPTVVAGDELADELSLEDLRAFTDVWRYIKTHYVEVMDDRELLEAAMRGMLSELDPHSKWLSTEELESLEQQAVGHYGGVGIQIGVLEDQLQVVSVFAESPARDAGLEPGDRIVAIDNKALDRDNIGNASAWLRGKPGTAVDLVIEREGQPEPLELALTRQVIQRSSVSSHWLAEHFVHLEISRFQQNTTSQLDAEIARLGEAEPPPAGLILDLRDNPGGVLQVAVSVSDRFLSNQLVVTAEGRGMDSPLEYRTGPEAHFPDLPMVVLVDGASASASEIVAGALRDHGRALIVGEPTYGKGSVQTIWPLKNGSGIRLTTALYFTPAGHRIQANGITPDVISNPQSTATSDNGARRRESDRRGHLPAEPAAPDPAAELRQTDPMLADALRLLQSMARMKTGDQPG